MTTDSRLFARAPSPLTAEPPVPSPTVTSGATVSPVAPATTAPFPTALLLLTPKELLDWQTLCKENPLATPESCLERLKLKAVSAETTGAASAAPSVTPGDDCGKGVGSVSESAVAGKKRKSKQVATRPQKVRVKVEVEETVSDAEARQLVREMHTCALIMVRDYLPDVVAGLPQEKKRWAEYKQQHGGDFSKGSVLTLLVRSNGKRPTAIYDDRVKAVLVTRNAALAERFYKVFPNFEVLRGRMNKLQLQWAAWWQ